MLTTLTAATPDVVEALRSSERSATLQLQELEELLRAVDDRLEVLVDADRRAALQRGRFELETFVARLLAT